MTGWRFWVLLAVLGAVGLALVALVAFVLPPLLVPDDVTGQDVAALENDVRGTLLQGLLGFAFLAAAVGTWRQVQIASRQVQIAERGQITERFTNAIDQLGKEDSPDVRLGGIYSIEQIAQDNPETYHDLMSEILSAYVRRRSPRTEQDSQQEPDSLPVDIQAALTVLGRRTLRFGELPVNLTRANLAGANLFAANLYKANLYKANLTNALLIGANLEGATLEGANLTKVNLNLTHIPDITYNDDTIWPEGFHPTTKQGVSLNWQLERQRRKSRAGRHRRGT